MPDIILKVPTKLSINIKNGDNTESNIKIGKETGTTDHTKLRHLAFDESGHTGFQRELTQEQLESIEAVSQKVDKVTGKGLSSNDFTNEDKTKVNNAVPNLRKIAEVSLNHDITIDELRNKLKYFEFRSGGCEIDIDTYTEEGIYRIEYHEIETSLFGGPSFGVTLENPYILLVFNLEIGLDECKIVQVKIQDEDISIRKATKDTGNYIEFDFDDEPDEPDTIAWSEWFSISGVLESKVDKVTGKGLSSNDYTNEDKAKVNSCASVSYVDSAISQAITDTLNSEV